MLEQFQDLLNQYDTATHLPIALADIEFTFPSDCKYPSLSVKLDNFGLINPLIGRTVATLPEVHLALYQGATIIYHDAVVIEDYKLPDGADINDVNDDDIYAFRAHLFQLYKLRTNAKKNDQELLQQLYKTYSNSLYGKISQGIRERKMYNTRDGMTKKLPKSPITNSYYASMTTGLVRAALSSIIVALHELILEGHNYIIISATTDGLLYGIDETKVTIEDTIDMDNKKYTYDSLFEAFKDGYNKFNSFEKVDPILYERLLKFPSLNLLKLSHEAWDDPEYIDIKHVANKVTNVKTRGQIGLYDDGTESICTILAKAGHKVDGEKDEQAIWMLEHYEDADIQQYEFTTLSNIQDIVSEVNPIDDLVSIPQESKISLDYDYKRYPINGNDTAPHKDVNQFMKYRQSSGYLRRLGQRGTVDAVDYKYKLAEQNVRKTGSNKQFALRHVLRAMVHGVKPFSIPNLSRSRLSILLQEFGVTVSKLGHAKESVFTPYMVSDTTANRAYIRKILRKLGYRTRTNYKNYLDLLLHKKISNTEDVCYLD